jgi:hypothetical protein
MTTPRRPPHAAEASDGSSPTDAEPSEQEARAAAELRDALSNPSLANEDAELLRALALAETPRPLGADEHRAILERALSRAQAAPTREVRRRTRTGRVIQVAFGAVTATLAIAASVVFLVEPKGEPAPALARVRSTQPLFVEPFARVGGESSRVDRIALARASDFRDNEFSRWGVR